MSDRQALDAAVRLLGPERGHQWLGCDWGTKVATPDDREVCTEQAHRLVVVHGTGTEKHELKLCQGHTEAIERETDPHREEGATTDE